MDTAKTTKCGRPYIYSFSIVCGYTDEGKQSHITTMYDFNSEYHKQRKLYPTLSSAKSLGAVGSGGTPLGIGGLENSAYQASVLLSDVDYINHVNVETASKNSDIDSEYIISHAIANKKCKEYAVNGFISDFKNAFSAITFWRNSQI